MIYKVKPVTVNLASEPDTRPWTQRVHDAALHEPRNVMTLHRLRDLEHRIRDEAAASGEETCEHIEAIALVCAYKLQIMRDIDRAREEARERAYLGARAIGAIPKRLSMAERDRLYEQRKRGFHD